jgi:hypothetical protein
MYQFLKNDGHKKTRVLTPGFHIEYDVSILKVSPSEYESE